MLLRTVRMLANQTIRMFSCNSYQWDDFSWFGDHTMGELVIVLDQIANVDIAIELFEERIVF